MRLVSINKVFRNWYEILIDRFPAIFVDRIGFYCFGSPRYEVYAVSILFQSHLLSSKQPHANLAPTANRQPTVEYLEVGTQKPQEEEEYQRHHAMSAAATATNAISSMIVESENLHFLACHRTLDTLPTAYASDVWRSSIALSSSFPTG